MLLLLHRNWLANMTAKKIYLEIIFVYIWWNKKHKYKCVCVCVCQWREGGGRKVNETNQINTNKK